MLSKLTLQARGSVRLQAKKPVAPQLASARS
jgi:hypothetical protein